jgi:hypothetical protein
VKVDTNLHYTWRMLIKVGPELLYTTFTLTIDVHAEEPNLTLSILKESSRDDAIRIDA